MFSVITSPNRNLCGWNLEHKWRGTVHTHIRKLGEIAAGAPPQGAKTCFVFLLWIQCGLSATYPALISIFLKQQTWIAFRMCTPVKIFRISAQGFCRSQNSSKYGTLGQGGCARLQLKRYNCGRSESFRGLVNVQRMCLLYVSFGGRRTVWAL